MITCSHCFLSEDGRSSIPNDELPMLRAMTGAKSFGRTDRHRNSGWRKDTTLVNATPSIPKMRDSVGVCHHPGYEPTGGTGTAPS